MSQVHSGKAEIRFHRPYWRAQNFPARDEACLFREVMVVRLGMIIFD